MPKTDASAYGEPPLMSGPAFRDLLGISDVQLRYYRENGILEPLGRSEAPHTLYYAIDQMPLGQLVDALRHNDMGVADIAGVVAQGEEALINCTRQQCAEEIRRIRRRLKAVTNLERTYRDFRAVAGKRGTYLRYLPVRRMALLPIEGDDPCPPDSAQLIAAHRSLDRIVSAVGWSGALSYGVILSLSADMRRASRYAYIELASPPMPVITGSRIVDGGCYSAVAPKSQRMPCHGKNCALCARFGREPEPGERQAWHTTGRREPWRQAGTVMVDQLDAPYEDGMWMHFTQEALGASAPSGDEWHPSAPAPSVPRKMPHVSPLPLGATACEFPAGAYLCRNFSAAPGNTFAEASRTTLAALMAILKQLPLADPPASSPAPARRHGQRPEEEGPYVEPFAAPRFPGDPQLEGAHASLSANDLREVELPLRTALWPENGLCIIGAASPLAVHPEKLMREYQVFALPSPSVLEKLQN